MDRHPRLRALRGGPDGRAIRVALGIAFPDLAPARRERLLRATLRQRAYNALATVVVSRIPRFGAAVARAIRIEAPRTARAALEGDGPIVIATFHTGPLLLLLATIQRVLRGRTVHAMHQSGNAYYEQTRRFIRGIGNVSVSNSPMALRTLIRAFREAPRPAVVFGCDFSPGPQTVSFLGRTMSVTEGPKLLAGIEGATVLIAMWERCGIRPRVRFAEAISAQRYPGNESLQRIFDELEPLVAASPHRWTAWETFAERVAERSTPLDGSKAARASTD